MTCRCGLVGWTKLYPNQPYFPLVLTIEMRTDIAPTARIDAKTNRQKAVTDISLTVEGLYSLQPGLDISSISA